MDKATSFIAAANLETVKDIKKELQQLLTIITATTAKFVSHTSRYFLKKGLLHQQRNYFIDYRRYMKKLLFLLITVAFLFTTAKAQKTSYTNQQPPLQWADEMKLIANVGGTHHLLVMRRKDPPLLYIYDQNLNLRIKKELPIALLAEDAIKVLAYKTFYYLHITSTKNNTTTLWKITATGEYTDKTNTFQNLLQTQLGENKSKARILIAPNRFYLVYTIRRPEASLAETTMLIADSLLQQQQVRRVSYVFNNEHLQQMEILNDDHLLLLTTGVNNEAQNFIKLVNINTSTGKIFSTNYKSNGGSFYQSRFFYQSNDSTTLLSSFIKPSEAAPVTNIFISQFADSLTEVAPASLQKMKGQNLMVLINSQAPRWLLFSNQVLQRVYQYNQRITTTRDVPETIPGSEMYPNLFRTNTATDKSIDKTVGSIQYLLVNKQLKNTAETFEKNDKKKYKVFTDSYAQFSFNGSSILLLKQQFPSKRKGLLLVSGTEKEGLNFNDLPVNDRYEFELNQLQQLPDQSVLLPFVYKGEAGIMRLRMD